MGWLLAYLAFAALLCRVGGIWRRPRWARQAARSASPVHPKVRKKPPRVCDEVIRLKALMPHEGCRTIAAAFNARHARRNESVGKTFVALTLKRHATRVLELRKQIKNRQRFQGTRNLVWGMDVTFLSTDQDPIPALGILDHGTRALLDLRPLVDRTTIGVLRFLLDVIERCGHPKFLRTDNEAIFNSRLMHFALWVLGIRKQTTDPFCPWQNGRIERFFRTSRSGFTPGGRWSAFRKNSKWTWTPSKPGTTTVAFIRAWPV